MKRRPNQLHPAADEANEFIMLNSAKQPIPKQQRAAAATAHAAAKTAGQQTQRLTDGTTLVKRSTETSNLAWALSKT